MFLVLSASGNLVRGVEAVASDKNIKQQGMNMNLVGQIGGSANSVALVGDYAYLCEGPRLIVLDVSSLELLVMVGKTQVMPGTVQDIAVAGNYGYAIVGGIGLAIIDISEPTAPLVVNTLAKPVRSVTLAGDHAYLSGSASVYIIS